MLLRLIILIGLISVNAMGQNRCQKELDDKAKLLSQIHLNSVRYQYLKSSGYLEFLKNSQKNTKESCRVIDTKAFLNASYSYCLVNKDCEDWERIIKVRKKYKDDYPYDKYLNYNYEKPEQIELVRSVDVKNKILTTDQGNEWSYASGSRAEQIKTQDQVATQATVTTPETAPKSDSMPGATQELEKPTAKPASSTSGTLTCEWSDIFPRKILRGPGCSGKGTKICIGYVNCTEGGASFNRLATCTEKLCGDGQAAACSKQLGFGSYSPAGVDPFVKPTGSSDSSVN